MQTISYLLEYREVLLFYPPRKNLQITVLLLYMLRVDRQSYSRCNILFLHCRPIDHHRNPVSYVTATIRLLPSTRILKAFLNKFRVKRTRTPFTCPHRRKTKSALCSIGRWQGPSKCAQAPLYCPSVAAKEKNTIQVSLDFSQWPAHLHYNTGALPYHGLVH